MVITYTLLYTCLGGQYALVMVYAAAKPFSLGAGQVGFLISANWGARALVQVLQPLVLARCGCGAGGSAAAGSAAGKAAASAGAEPELAAHRRCVLFGALWAACFNVGIGFARTPPLLFTLCFLEGFSTVWSLSLRT